MHRKDPRNPLMAEDLLVGEQLTQDMITAGEHVLTALDKTSVQVKVALWLLLAEQHTWRLVMASPAVRTLGPREVYRKVAAVIKRLPPSAQPIGIKDITVLEDTHELVQLMRSFTRTGLTLSKIRMSRNVVNGQLIEDALLYRVT